MLHSPNKHLDILKQQMYKRKLIVLLITISSIYILPACYSTSSSEIYVIPNESISLELPSNWDVSSNDRVANFMVLQSKKGLLERNSARIEMFYNRRAARLPIDLENLEKDIERIGRLYGLTSVTIIESPRIIADNDYEIAMAVISIPTMSIPKDSSRNQTGHRDANLSQIIELYSLANDHYYLSLYVYKGNSDELNAQAQDIINSIQLMASDQSNESN